MARQIITVLTDDISGKEGDVETIPFALDGVAYEIDLGTTNARAFRKALGVYCDKARKVRSTASPKARPTKRTDLAAVRLWARDQGIEVSDKGRVPQSVLDAYDAR